MKYIADLHIHSHFSRATSKQLTPEHLDYWARLKGVDVLGTGDCTHPGWLAELREKLQRGDDGFYRLKKAHALKGPGAFLSPGAAREVCFTLSGEISSIYKKDGRVRKVHTLFTLPDLEAARKLQDRLSKRGNIASDGRPILGISAKEVLEMLLEVSDRALVIPAHIWTPWFSVLGDRSGFERLEECYEELTSHIFAVETGLSSDPPMNRVCSFLDRFRLVSNSDAHSPAKLGREANLFDADLSYGGMYEALRSGAGFTGTVEFFPEEGKYHFDGHRKCGVCWDPLETVRHKGICPVCGKPVTKGVMYRVAALADRRSPGEAKDRNEYFSITSLPSLVAELAGTNEGTKKADRMYFDVLAKLGPDLHTLLFAPLDEIKEKAGELLAEGIRRMRCREVKVEGGFDGEFGKVSAFKEGELAGGAPAGKKEKPPCRGARSS
ncbi:MAG: endonuclease Q family protein, partial [Endomicrobiales bacterium]